MRKNGERTKKEAESRKMEAIPDDIMPTYYVALGASAGGLEAIESFFTHMPSASGLGFIVIQHLSPDYKSLMVELLSKKTAMPVHRAEDGMQVLPNHVYLIPPKKNLTIFHGKLLLSEQEHHKGINLPIDVFLRSLAEDQAEKAVAVILSGTGSDGTRGVRAIKEYGGMVMVQEEESAKFNGMPRAAISTGLVDFVLPPEKLPRQLLAFAQHPYVVKAERSESLLSDEEGLTRIFAILREKCKVDFTFYKPSTVTRRIERRMTIQQIGEIREYASFLQSNPSEAMALYRELLIGVTSFFRDPEAFDRLVQNGLADILKASHVQEIRFWVAGCSTGEEAYSLAILTRECMEANGISRDVKIFATDIDRDAIHYAASGIYPESIAADLSPKLLSKYFYRKEESFQIVRSIREMVVFAPHNLIKDPPFTNIALISCRNFLIYLQPVLQRKVLENFNFSLPLGGILMLGTSETTGEMSDYFEALDTKYKLYRSKGRLKPASDPLPVMSVTDTRARDLRGRYAGVRRALRASEEERLLERFLDGVASDYIPLALVVNETMEVLHVVGDAQGYLRLPSGKLVNDISRMAAKELAIPLSTGIQKVFRQHQELRFSNIRLPAEQGVRLVDLRIKPLPEKKGQESLVAVFIGEVKKNEPASPGVAVSSYDLSKETEDRLRDLEQELQFSRENLQATIEELETSNEELQATNEELLASNEELQSTNEELQSTNEELFTVNSEYQSKIIELTELHNDVENLLSAIHIGQLILDENLEVRRFSKRVCEIFKLLDSDIGRPITHISHFLSGCDPLQSIRQVQADRQPVEQEVRGQDNRWYLMRVVPYKIGPKSYSGTVVSFVDITLLKRTEEARRESQNLFASVANASPAMVWMADVDKKCIWFNEPWLAFTGCTMQQELGYGWAQNVHPLDLPGCIRIYEKAFDNRKSFSMEYRLRRHDGVYRWLLDEGLPRCDANGQFAGYIGFCLDITERKNTEEEARQREKELLEVQRLSKIASFRWDLKSDHVLWTEQLFTIVERAADSFPNTADAFFSFIHPDDREQVRKVCQDSISGKSALYVEYRLMMPDGRIKHVVSHAQMQLDADGRTPMFMIGYNQDVSSRKNAELALEACRAKCLELQHELDRKSS